MATGDVTISVAVEGGVTKSVSLASATRVKNKLYRDGISADADWQLDVVNGWAGRLIEQANNQLELETTFTPQTFTAAT